MPTIPAGQHVGSYVIVRHIADGGTSEVYEVTGDGQTFALKILKKEHRGNTALQARLLNEAAALLSLQIEGVVCVRDTDDFEGRPYFVMEHLPGSLVQHLPGPLPPREIVPILADLARVLAALHARGIVHRDLKPHNILFAPDGRLRLVDFSHAKHSKDEGTIIPHSTESGAFLGTREYAAPEQLLNAKGVDGHADVYALGLLLFESLTGQRPFAPSDPEDLALRRLTQQMPRLSSFIPDLPAPLVTLVDCMLRRTPQERPTAQDVAKQLTTILLLPSRSSRRGLLRTLPLFLVLLLQPPPPRRASLDDFGRALETQTVAAAEVLLQEVEDPRAPPGLRARQILKRADLAWARGQLAAAARLYEDAYHSFQQQGDRRHQSVCGNRWADVYSHQGDVASALHLYEESLDQHQVLSAHQKNRGDEFALTDYRIGLLYADQDAWEEAHKWLLLARDAAPTPFEISRAQERLATLPQEHKAALAHAQDALRNADLAIRSDPASNKARLARLRALEILGELLGDTRRLDEVLASKRALSRADPECGLWAHEFLESLVRRLRRVPGDKELVTEARDVLQQIGQRGQWRNDVHLKRWRAEISARAVPAATTIR